VIGYGALAEEYHERAALCSWLGITGRLITNHGVRWGNHKRFDQYILLRRITWYGWADGFWTYNPELDYEKGK
jgi:hypothetical protein